MRVEVAKIPSSVHKFDAMETLATLCYFYPQYTLKEARHVPYKQVKLLLNVARRQKAIELMRLTEIAAAPHTKNMSGVKSLIKLFKGMTK